MLKMEGHALIEKSSVASVVSIDNTNADIKKNHYDVVFILKGCQPIAWSFNFKDARDAALKAVQKHFKTEEIKVEG